MIRLIVTDLDNTLLNTNKVITDYTARVFRELQRRGIAVAFATARPERMTRSYFDRIAPDFVIANNGASVYRGGETLLNLEIPQDTALALLSACEAEEKITYYCAETGDALLVNEVTDWASEGWSAVYRADLGHMKEIHTPKISVACADADIPRGLVAAYPGLCACSNRGEDWHQITRADATKPRGIACVCDVLGITVREAAAFGDDSNDVEMLKICGTGVAVENAIAEAKRAANCICPSCDEDGVARWLSEYLSV